MISVIIPVYKHEKSLQQTLASLSFQTLHDFEIIIVDDGNEPPLNARPNTQVIRQEHSGAAAARNRGAREAKGEYLLFLDADIWLKPDYLEKMLEALKSHPEASYAYSQFKFGFKTFNLWPFDEAKLKLMPYIHTASLIRKIDFPGFDTSIKRLQDWDLWLSMLEQNKKGVFIPQILFRVTAGGSMSKWLPSFLYNFKWLPSVKKYNEAVKI